MEFPTSTVWTAVGLFALAALVALPAAADQQILDDLIVDGSACIGQDCVNGESFGFDTIRLKENNLRIKFQDTSSTASFPTRDWQITINDSSNGGANRFSVDDIDGSRTPFTIEGGAPSHSLYVDDGGRIGFGTSTPVVELHVKDGDTPTLRLEQDGSSGFTAQTWDVAGNETNFFVRDVSNGSKLVLRLRPGAPTSSIDVAGDGDVGMGTTTPGTLNTSGGATSEASVHVRRTDGDASILIEEATASDATAKDMLELRASQGPIRLRMNAEGFNEWVHIARGNYEIADGTTIVSTLTPAGNLTITGSLTASGSTFPDYVFEPGYELMPLDRLAEFVSEKKHLPNVFSAADISAAGGINMTELQLQLLEKIEELVLYTLEQQKTIDALRADLESLKQAAE